MLCYWLDLRLCSCDQFSQDHVQTASDCRFRVVSSSHLFKECHGELLVGDAVSGCADVFFGLVCDVEVNPHQDVFLQEHRTSENEPSHLVQSEPVL